MPKFSTISYQRLTECHHDLQTLFNEVIKSFDCSILVGHRNEADQNKAFAEGKSKLKYPFGNHNSIPSMAVDVAPHPLDWKESCRFYYFAGYVLGIANQLLEKGEISHKIRWGGDWDGDNELKDNAFADLVHYELKKP